VEGGERELALYRRLGGFVGIIYLVWWAAIAALLPRAYNPLLGRLVVVVAIWLVVAASYANAWVRDRIRLLWTCGLWLLTAHYFYLFYENAGDINWVVGSFITITAVTLAFFSRASLIAYSVFTLALSIGLVVAIPNLRQSVFLPGLMTVLLQANIGLDSRLRVLRDLATSNDHFQLLFDSTFEGVLIYEAGRIVQVNAALVRILGYGRDELVGRDVLELVHADDRDAARANVLAAASAPIELRCIGKTGAEVDVEIRVKPFAAGRRVQQLVTVEDIGERKRRATELQRTNDALARSNVDLQRFAYIASHDLQTPLRSIASFVDLLRSTYGNTLDAQATDWLARTSQSVDHLQALIRDLLDYSRVETEQHPFETVPMREVLDRARVLLDAEIREASATITADDLPDVIGNRTQLVQVVTNLVGNAVKYRSAEPPKIHIAAKTRDGDWLFEVRDNGIGIAPKHHVQVFEVFKRLHDRKAYPGTGIGLAICRRIVDRHGGKIWVESAAGEGSAFYFTIAKANGDQA
jgi:PAS domain S-box-containing protein